MRRQMRTWSAMLVTASLVTGAATVTHGQDEAAQTNPRCQWTTEAAPVQMAVASAAGGSSTRFLAAETQGPEAELRGVCQLPPWDPSGVWPFKNERPKQGFFVPGVGAGEAPSTQITGMGFTTVRLKKGGALKALGNLKKRDDVSVLGMPNKKGEYQLIFLYTRDVPGALAASYHFAGDRDGDKTNNVATSVDLPSHPFQDTQLSADIVFAGGDPALAFTDFGQPGGFYNLTGEAAYAV